MFLVKYTRIMLAFTNTRVILNLSSWNTKEEIKKNVLVALFHAIVLNRCERFQGSKRLLILKKDAKAP